MPRTLVIMGSGETTPGMLGVHRAVFAALPPQPACRLMDSPFAFQENADELVERIGQYFRESLGQAVERVRLPAEADPLTLERALADVRAADWLFAGPGSPSYARRCWQGTPVPAAMAAVVAPGRTGALVLASAAAVTLGDWALPVYEIYKVGEDPRWEPGLGLMGLVLGWRCAVVPHYDNREGGTHDTRFCYVGGRRLASIEPQLDGGFILGIDEHTALVVDLERRSVQVAGRGAVTLRVTGVEDVLPEGSELSLAEVEARIAALGAPAAVGRTDPAPSSSEPAGALPTAEAEPREVDELARAVLAVLPAEATAARAHLVDLADRAQAAAQDRSRELAAELVDALVQIRAERREARDWAGSDQVRDLLAGVGVEVRDGAEGSTWQWT
ncbi:MAG TPA: hypothetical protein VF143_00735 [Candidatus Nanopelagicales bacterium]